MRLRNLIISVVGWGVFLGIVYSITAVRIDHAKDKIRDSGIETIQELSKLVRLPLLDSNTQIIHALLVYAAKTAGMVHASVVDHRNEIVTLTGAEHVMPVSDAASKSGNQVLFWEGELPDHRKIFSFASDLTYAGTKIGRLHIALSAEEPFRIRSQFTIVAVLSFLVLLLLIVAIRYYPGIWEIPATLTNIYRRDDGSDVALENSLINCPLCGTEKPFSRELFKRSNSGRLLIIKASLNKSEAGGGAGAKSIHLSDLAKRDDLSWFKRKIMLRCAEIITKLAA